MTGAARVPPVWPASPSLAEQSRPLEGDSRADVAVIGGGFAGLTAALELAAGGRTVILLEATNLAAGASAASAGQVGPLFYGANATPEKVIARLGAERGSRLNRLVAASGRWLFETIAARGIACDARTGLLCLSRSAKGLDRAADRFAQWRLHGGRAERVGRDDLFRWVGSSRYVGGFFLPDGGMVDPARLIEGLADAARRAGVAVHARSRVTALQRSNDAWRIFTAQGGVVAKDVLVATGTAGLHGWPGLAASAYPVPCGIAATAPLADRAKSLLPEGGPVVDLDDKAVFAPAVTADGRLLLSFLISSTSADLAVSPAPGLRRLARAFPGHSMPAFESLSWGRIGLTPDGLPRLLQRPDGLVAVAGCNGLGLTLGIAAAREAARLILGVPADRLALPLTIPKPLPAARLVPLLFRTVMAPLANRFAA